MRTLQVRGENLKPMPSSARSTFNALVICLGQRLGIDIQPMSDHHRPPDQIINVNVHLPALAELAALVIKGFNELRKDIATMSSTVSQKIDDAAARDEAATAKLSADLTAIAEELKANTPDPGSIVTQAQADRHLAVAAALEAAAAAADALVTPTPVPEPPVA